MIPVFQTRERVEELGNCYQACLASVLELPLEAIPDLSRFVDGPAWAATVARARERGDRVGELVGPAGVEEYDAELEEWLAELGIGRLRLMIDRDRRGGRRREAKWLEDAAGMGAYWIGLHDGGRDGAGHAIVWHGAEPAHNPSPGLLGLEGCGPLAVADVLVVADIARLEIGVRLERELARARRVARERSSGGPEIRAAFPGLEVVRP